MMSLGCPKTLVDSETILGKLPAPQYALVPSVTDCDIALLNTCAFIHDAQEESVNRILELIELKKEKRIRAIIVMGCLVQRYPRELQQELKEVDAFIGSGDYHKIPEIVGQVFQGERIISVAQPGYLSTSGEARVALTPRHYRYVKISEGCDHICAFCTIPSFRGKHRSRTIADIRTETSRLITEGAKEIILTGQDTTFYGKDLEGRFLMPDLIRALDDLPGLAWLRILYAYPSCIPPEMIAAMKDAKHVCHYLDMPLQHASDAMLAAMRRGITKRRTYDLIRRFRDAMPDLAIRTTFIVGFPGETDEDFEELLAFMRENRFERLGIFTYSQEEGTAAAGMPGQVEDAVKRERLDIAMRLQQEISREKNEDYLNRTLDVLIDGPDEHEPHLWAGRTYMDAPEVDGNVFVESREHLQVGRIYPVRILKTKEYDLVGKIQAVV